MEVKVDKSFNKDIDKIRNDKWLNKKIKDTITNILEAKNILEIKSIKKISGFDSFYRIRIGDYRMGMEIIDNTVILLRFKDRKNIYDVFPPR